MAGGWLDLSTLAHTDATVEINSLCNSYWVRAASEPTGQRMLLTPSVKWRGADKKGRESVSQ